MEISGFTHPVFKEQFRRLISDVMSNCDQDAQTLLIQACGASKRLTAGIKFTPLTNLTICE